MATKILIIDNYDSFTYNLVHLVNEIGLQCDVWRNDRFKLEDVEAYDKIILSPGPGIPAMRVPPSFSITAVITSGGAPGTTVLLSSAGSGITAMMPGFGTVPGWVGSTPGSAGVFAGAEAVSGWERSGWSTDFFATCGRAAGCCDSRDGGTVAREETA